MNDAVSRALAIAAREREKQARGREIYTDDFVEGLRSRGMGAWRRHVLEDGVTVEFGRRVPDSVVGPIPGVPADGPHVVVASPSWVVPEKRRRK